MSETAEYVSADGHGAYRVGGSRVMLDSVLTAWAQGHSPETIRSQYPTLSLEEVYGAITWSLSHRAEVAAYLKKQDAAWEQWRKRSEQAAAPLRDRLRVQRQHAEPK